MKQKVPRYLILQPRNKVSWRKKKLQENKFTPGKKAQKYPMWTFVRVQNTDNYYLLLEKNKMQFISTRAFVSWRKPYVLVTEESISNYTKWKNIGFSLGTIVISQADNTTWYITGSDILAAERRLITSPDFFNVLGFNIQYAFKISLAELDFHKKGENLI